MRYEPMSLKEYKVLVTKEMERRYGISWDDACGDDEPLEQARMDHERPADFVMNWGLKYGLTSLRRSVW